MKGLTQIEYRVDTGLNIHYKPFAF